MTAKPQADPQADASLESAIDKAKEVAAEIQQAADNLAVVNTVLQDQIPEDIQTGEVAQALGQSDEVEKTITKSAEVLNEVNTELDKAAAAAGATRP